MLKLCRVTKVKVLFLCWYTFLILTNLNFGPPFWRRVYYFKVREKSGNFASTEGIKILNYAFKSVKSLREFYFLSSSCHQVCKRVSLILAKDIKFYEGIDFCAFFISFIANLCLVVFQHVL